MTALNCSKSKTLQDKNDRNYFFIDEMTIKKIKDINEQALQKKKALGFNFHVNNNRKRKDKANNQVVIEKF